VVDVAGVPVSVVIKGKLVISWLLDATVVVVVVELEEITTEVEVIPRLLVAVDETDALVSLEKGMVVIS